MMGERDFGSESHEDEVWVDFLIKAKHELEAVLSFFWWGETMRTEVFCTTLERDIVCSPRYFCVC